MLKRLLAAVLAVLSMSVFAAVDANKASATELDSVKGIGPVIAGRIVAERGKAPFKDWDDLIKRVDGFGPKSSVKFSENGLTVNGASYQGAPAKTTAATAATKPAATAAPANPAPAGRPSTNAAPPTAPAPAQAQADAKADAKAAKEAAKKEKAAAKEAAKQEKAAAKEAAKKEKAAAKADKAASAAK